jgi:hypothetical protein
VAWLALLPARCEIDPALGVPRISRTWEEIAAACANPSHLLRRIVSLCISRISHLSHLTGASPSKSLHVVCAGPSLWGFHPLPPPLWSPTKSLAQYESPGRRSSSNLLLLAHPRERNSGQSGRSRGAMSNNGRRMPNSVVVPKIVAFLVRCGADHRHLAKPELPNRGRAGVHQYSEYLSTKYFIKVPCSGARGTTNHDRRGCSKRSTTWIFSTGVSGHCPPLKGGPALDQGCGRHRDRPFRPRFPKILSFLLSLGSPHGEIQQKTVMIIPEALHFTAAVRC